MIDYFTKYTTTPSWKAKRFKFDGSAFQKSFKMDIALASTLLFKLIIPHWLWVIFESSASLNVYYMNLLPLLLLIQSSLTRDEELSIRREGDWISRSLPTAEELITSDNVQMYELKVEQREIKEVLKIESSSRAISCNTPSEKQRTRRSLTIDEELSIRREGDRIRRKQA